MSALPSNITKPRAERMAEASRALQNCLRKVPIPSDQADVTANDAGASTTESLAGLSQREALSDSQKNAAPEHGSAADKDDTKAPPTSYLDQPAALSKLLDRPGGTLVLHDMLVQAAKQCATQNALVESFLPRMTAIEGVTESEAKAGLVIFHEMDKSSKLKFVFEVLAAANKNNSNRSSTPTTSNSSATKSVTPQKVAEDGSEEESAETSSEDKDGDKSKQQQQPEHAHKENALPNKEAAGTSAYPATPKGDRQEPPLALTLDQAGAYSLFQTILLAISCNVYAEDSIKTDEDSEQQHSDSEHDNTTLKPVVTLDEEHSSILSTKDSFDAPPKEMTKTGEASAAASKEEEQSPQAVLTSAGGSNNTSPASSGLSQDLIAEIKTCAEKASKSLTEYARSKSDKSSEVDVSISFDDFGAWYNRGGCNIVPWVELLRLSKWEKASAAGVPSSAATMVSQSTSSSSASHHQHYHPHHPQMHPHHQQHYHYPPHPPPSHRKPPLSSRKLAPKPSRAGLSSMLREDEQAMSAGAVGVTPHRGPPQQQYHQQHSYPHHVRTVVSFDFSASQEGAVAPGVQPLCTNLSEENLWVLRSLVYRSGLVYRCAADVCKSIMRMSHKRMWDGRPLVTLRRDDFRHLISSFISPPPPSSGTKTPQPSLSSTDVQNFGTILEDFFACFEGNFHQSTTTYHPLSHDEVNSKELAVGFCFLCAGNKSTKLATGFELLDDDRVGYLTQQQVMRFLRSYLTMMVGTSLLRENHSRKRQPLSHERKEEMRAAVENGAHWTLRHFLKNAREKYPENHAKDAYSFEIFADWYSKGGFNIAPWLELLDLNKMLSLLGESESFAAMPQGKHHSIYANSQASIRECRSSHRRQHHQRASTPTAQVLFTFPLADQRSLIVLREDAIYVRGVVEQLGALSLSSHDIWSGLLEEVKQRPHLRGPGQTKPRRKKDEPEKNTMLDQNTFVQMMEAVLQTATGPGTKRNASGGAKLSSSVRELLCNFFHSYDLKESKTVALNELMGGLSLLCGGKKSTKLAFAFGVFDGRPQPKKGKGKKHKPPKNQSLDAQDLFLFLRSFMIVLFSCCCQTLDMSDRSVDRYITNTAKMVADDVMRYQWHSRKADRIDFDEFGEWYNEGGFEIAPWLELLDLKKWVLVDNFDALDTQAAPPPGTAAPLTPSARSPKGLSPGCPPAPPEDVLDPSFFEGGHDDIMNMDSMDEMDIMLMPSHDKEGDMLPDGKFTYSPGQDQALEQGSPAGGVSDSQSLKFHLLSEDDQGGFVLSISQKRIGHLRQVMLDCGLHDVPTETACAAILDRASGSAKSKSRTITKTKFEEAVRDVLGSNDQGVVGESHRCLTEVLSSIFSAFDLKRNGKPSALEVACGLTVLCRGKKSDKLEYAFEVLDKGKKGVLSKDDMFNYMRSFLTVLLAIACTPVLDTDELEDTLTTMNTNETCDRSTDSLMRAVKAGSTWAVAQAFKGGEESMSFDDFASWYTETYVNDFVRVA